MDTSKIGVLTEQGYPVGSGYGFNEASKQDEENLKEDLKKKTKKDN